MAVDAVTAHAERLKRKIGQQSGPHVQGVEAGAITKFATDDIAQNDLPIRPGDVLTTVPRYAEVFINQGRSDSRPPCPRLRWDPCFSRTRGSKVSSRVPTISADSAARDPP